MTPISHDDANALLPWFVNGTLDKAEHFAVQEHVRHCDTCREGIDILSSVQAAILRETTVPFKPKSHVEQVFDRIDSAETHRVRPRLAHNWLIAASLAAIALFIGIVIGRSWNAPGTEGSAIYETVTSTREPAGITFQFTVTFRPGSSEEVIEEVLSVFDADDVSVDRTSAMRRLAIEVSSGSLQELTRLVSSLEAQPSVLDARVEGMEISENGPE